MLNLCHTDGRITQQGSRIEPSFSLLLPTPNAGVSRPVLGYSVLPSTLFFAWVVRNPGWTAALKNWVWTPVPSCILFLMWTDDKWSERRDWKKKKIHPDKGTQERGTEHRLHWRRQKKIRKKSLVSLVSITRLKGQMESQWGSLSGSHYWNRKFFFLFTYTQVIPGSSSL